jgi:two-component system sensor histidine kinase AtoS
MNWRLVLDKLPDVISIHSRSGEVQWANRALCELYGKPLSQLIGLSHREAFPHDPGQDSETVSVATQFEVQFFGKPFQVTIEPIIDAEQRVSGFVRIMRDATGARIYRDRLQQAERLASLGQLMNGLAHSVGTPLNIISGYAEFLLMRSGPGAQGSKELSAILDQTRRIAALFSDALDMARLPTLRNESINLSDLLGFVLDLASYQLRKSNVKCEVTCAIALPLIYGEAPQLKQAFFNLLLNAAEEIGSGGEMEVRLEQSEERAVTVAISGSRSGIAHDFSELAGWFSMPSPELSSSGLGLWLAREILESSGASVVAGKRTKRGVPLLVHLPVGGNAQLA